MLSLTYQIEVDATAETVWDTLISPESYGQWASAFSPKSQFSGQWAQGEQILFFDPDTGGTRAVIDVIEPNKRLEYHHVAVFSPDRVQQLDSDSATKWIGSKECYHIEQTNESVLLTVTIETHPDFVAMFNRGWEQALPLIKALSEQDC